MIICTDILLLIKIRVNKVQEIWIIITTNFKDTNN